MRILNLYAGIGGNRKYWGNQHDITAVEYDPRIAEIYQRNFPNDKVVVGDAHQYLLEHLEEFDFIWSSPPYPTHSRIRKVFSNQNKPVYPDMKLYEEVLFLQGYFDGLYCVENVRAWYKPLIEPQDRASHWFWANFEIPDMKIKTRKHYGTLKELAELKGSRLEDLKGVDKRVVLRNCVEPETGRIILEAATNKFNQ